MTVLPRFLSQMSDSNAARTVPGGTDRNVPSTIIAIHNETIGTDNSAFYEFSTYPRSDGLPSSHVVKLFPRGGRTPPYVTFFTSGLDKTGADGLMDARDWGREALRNCSTCTTVMSSRVYRTSWPRPAGYARTAADNSTMRVWTAGGRYVEGACGGYAPYGRGRRA